MKRFLGLHLTDDSNGYVSTDKWKDAVVEALFVLSAPSFATLSLLVSVLVVVLLTVGVVLARRKRFNAHKWVQTAAVTLNLVLVVAVMLQSFAKNVASQVPAKLGDSYYSLALVHGLFGLVAVVFGVFVLLRGHGLVPRALQFSNYKVFMRTAYGLYVVATLLGAWVYANWYGTGGAQSTALASTTETAPDQITVPMTNFTFAPHEVVVPEGATVVWVNQDRAPHNVVADDGTTFRSELLSNGQQFTATFGTVGVFPYYCELHGAAGGTDMAGVVRVVRADEAPAVAVRPTAAAQPTAADVLAGAPTLPQAARGFIVQLLDDGAGLPARQGYVTGLQTQADELVRHATFVARAHESGDLPALRRHAEHIYNLLAGSLDSQFGDLDGDGRAQNPGDGFGLLPNGAQIGYIQATYKAASDAANATDATDAIRLHAGHVQVSAENMRDWAGGARTIALRLASVQTVAGASADVQQLVALSQQIARGVDVNGDGEIAPIQGEGGALVAHEHARYMAGLGFSPTAAP